MAQAVRAPEKFARPVLDVATSRPLLSAAYVSSLCWLHAAAFYQGFGWQYFRVAVH